MKTFLFRALPICLAITGVFATKAKLAQREIAARKYPPVYWFPVMQILNMNECVVTDGIPANQGPSTDPPCTLGSSIPCSMGLAENQTVLSLDGQTRFPLYNEDGSLNGYCAFTYH